MLRGSTFRRVLVPASIVGLGALGACVDGLFVTPARTVRVRLGLEIQPAAAMAGTDADACAKANGARVRLLQSDQVDLDTTVAASRPCDNPINLEVPVGAGLGALQLSVDLLANGQPVFRGSAAIELERGQRTDAQVSVAPVAAGIAAPDSLRTFTKLGDSLRLGGAVVFATGDTLQGAQPSWADDGKGIVRVVGGFVHSQAEGSAALTASSQGVTHATRVAVKAVVALVAISGVTSLSLGSTRTFTAVARDSNRNVLQRTIAWASSNPKVATVDAGGLVTAVGVGTTIIRAAAESKADSLAVTVSPVPVARVAVTPGSSTIFVTQTLQLTATTYDAAGNVLTGRSVAWSSSNSRVASVNSTGLVTGFSSGTTTITATSEGISGSASVTVNQAILVVTPATVYDTVFSVTFPVTKAPIAFSVTNAGTGTVSGLAAAVSNPAGQPAVIASATLSSTTAPATLTVQFNPLFSGDYIAFVVVSSTTPGTTSVVVTINLHLEPVVASIDLPVQSIRLAVLTGDRGLGPLPGAPSIRAAPVPDRAVAQLDGPPGSGGSAGNTGEVSAGIWLGGGR